jgi:hypothetical protein
VRECPGEEIQAPPCSEFYPVFKERRLVSIVQETCKDNILHDENKQVLGNHRRRQNIAAKVTATRGSERKIYCIAHSDMEGVLVKLNRGLPWQKLNLTRRRIFLPANWT